MTDTPPAPTPPQAQARPVPPSATVAKAIGVLAERMDQLIARHDDMIAVIGRVGTAPSVNAYTGQTIGNTFGVRLSAGSPGEPANGVLVQALAANTANVYVGAAGVTTSTGFELQPGQAISFTCDVYDLFVVGKNNIDGVCWSVV